MDENEQELKSPMKRVGSTRKVFLFNNIRQQLNEHLRCLDGRVESQVSLIQELQDLFRRRGELELEYSKNLDKLVRSLQARHKEQKQKREQWHIFSAFASWSHLLEQTQSLSKDHATLSELYSVNIVSSLQTTIEDVQRIYKKCRSIGYDIHEEILRVLEELYATMKTYQKYEAEWKAAEVKLMTAEAQQQKLEQTIQKEKLRSSKKYRMIEKEILKRRTKYSDARMKALKAKNEYQLCLESSNTTIHKYFIDDLSDLIDCMDLGFSSMISRCLVMHVTADQGRARAILSQADNLAHVIHLIDSQQDKQKFMEQYHAAFMIPKRFEFQGQFSNDLLEQSVQKELYVDMETRLQVIGQRLNSLRTESEEIWKTLEMAEVKLLEHFNSKDCDVSPAFVEHNKGLLQKGGPAMAFNPKLKAEKEEIEDFYINKIREYIRGTSRIARLDAKAKYLREMLITDNNAAFTREILDHPINSKRKRIGRKNQSGRPKLFGGCLEEYLENTGEEIPLILRSCIRVINLYGLHHQGIFRVSGSQVEITNFKEAFERGEDPLADTTDASDINSVAGVLKLYLRELRVPLFPKFYFESFISIAEMQTKAEMVKGIRQFLQNLPNSVVIVIRYLFSFLNHLSEYADENMMDAYNLAICFGPTLMPAPEDKDQVQYQNQVNELIKNMIIYHEELFPKELGGCEYEKYISPHTLDMDVGDSPSEVLTEDPESDAYPSEDESEVLEAVAQFDFNARSSRELSLTKGDCIILRKQVSNDWWQGTVNGKEGLVPDKYISLKLKDEARLPAQNSQSMEYLYLENSCSSSTSMLVDNKDIAKYVVNDVYFNHAGGGGGGLGGNSACNNTSAAAAAATASAPASISVLGGSSSCLGLGLGPHNNGNGTAGAIYAVPHQRKTSTGSGNGSLGGASTSGGGGIGFGSSSNASGDSSSYSCTDGNAYAVTSEVHLFKHFASSSPSPHSNATTNTNTSSTTTPTALTSTTPPLPSSGPNFTSTPPPINHSSLMKLLKNHSKQYHDEPHSFENAIEFQNAYDEQVEKFETTV
ncbi:SLIT-ROBO Rho GTPase-activating protein 1-like [Musca domestica]|uniref:SLIT-ROBO Rho GTPase-activating protein 1 n=1 Tax=Musca domestica TaxID=7370 RepID=A0A1I8MLH9_MUSDO|nr:SLIT-ROBO Rho GTPase-activating protein 1 [Musca domestica]XP_058986684.1 SLIT-ROBO Rho GTPase-activating protein 1-like [Musca domestica]